MSSIINSEFNCEIKKIHHSLNSSHLIKQWDPTLIFMVSNNIYTNSFEIEAYPANMPLLFIFCHKNQFQNSELLESTETIDYIFSPLKKEEVLFRVNRILNKSRYQKELQKQNNQYRNIGVYNIINNKPMFINIISKLPYCAVQNKPILLLGGNEIDQEIIARTIHCLSNPEKNPFVLFDSKAIPKHLVAEKLFGVIKKTNNNGKNTKPGIIKSIKNGTLFIKNIHFLAVNIQLYLLNSLKKDFQLQSKNNGALSNNFQLIASTDYDLKQKIKNHLFCRELYQIFKTKLHFPPTQHLDFFVSDDFYKEINFIIFESFNNFHTDKFMYKCRMKMIKDLIKSESQNQKFRRNKSIFDDNSLEKTANSENELNITFDESIIKILTEDVVNFGRS